MNGGNGMKRTGIMLAISVASIVLTACGTPSNTPQNANGFGMISESDANAERTAFVSKGNSSTEMKSANVEHTTNPEATFQGCIYTEGKHHYQAVNISLGNPGEYPFNALLYYGTTCNPDDVADQIGFGEEFDFGGFGWTFWFNHFPNRKDMSAVWYVGEDSSQCVNYEIAPNC
jgi:hypothetical protein